MNPDIQIFSVYVIPQSCNQEYFRPPLVRVDPDRRCTVMLIYGTHLVVLPFRQEGVLDEHEQEGAFTGRYGKYAANLLLPRGRGFINGWVPGILTGCEDNCDRERENVP